MTIYEGLNLLATIVAILMSGAALWISIPLQRQQRRKIEEARARKTLADVRVTLFDDPRGTARFVIHNKGEGAARDVSLEAEPIEGRNSPILSGDKILPVAVLRPGDRVEVMAVLSQATGNVFSAKWRWLNEGGDAQEREGTISPQKG